jgi:uncharacterized membrane protein
MVMSGAFLFTLFLLFIIFLIIFAAVGIGIWLYRKNAEPHGRKFDSGDTPTPIEDKPNEILRERYARGEISQEEFEKIQKDLKR